MQHKRILFLVLCFFCAALVVSQNAPPQAAADAPPPDAPPTAEALITKGDAALKASNYEEALQSYSAAIKADPNNFNTYYKRAGLYLLRGKNKPALDDLNKVLHQSPTFLQARLRRGKVHLQFGNMEDAKNDFNEVLKTKPDHDLAKNQLASLEKCSQEIEQARELVNSNRFEEAQRVWSQVLDVSTENKEARLQRAKSRMNLGLYHEVLEDTMAVMKLQSGNIDALYLRGMAFYHLGEREAALKHYIEGLKYDPDNTACKGEFRRLNKIEKAVKAAEDKMTKGQDQEALEDYETAIGLEPNNRFYSPPLYLGKCKVFLKLKDVAKTLDACSKALELDDSLVDAYINKAEAQLLAEDYDKAIHEFNKARERQPNNQRIHEGISKAQRLQKIASRKDYYKILELTKTASDAEIRKSFRKLSLTWHPDKWHTEEEKDKAQKKYVEITEAYEVLSNPETRARWDNGEDVNQPGGGHHHHHGFEGFNPFGGGGHPGGGGFNFNFNFGGR